MSCEFECALGEKTIQCPGSSRCGRNRSGLLSGVRTSVGVVRNQGLSAREGCARTDGDARAREGRAEREEKCSDDLIGALTAHMGRAMGRARVSTSTRRTSTRVPLMNFVVVGSALSFSVYESDFVNYGSYIHSRRRLLTGFAMSSDPRGFSGLPLFFTLSGKDFF